MSHAQDPCYGCPHSAPSASGIGQACWHCLGYDRPKIDWAAKAVEGKQEWEQKLREAGKDMLL